MQRGVHGDKGGEKERSEGTEGRVRLTFFHKRTTEIWVVTHVLQNGKGEKLGSLLGRLPNTLLRFKEMITIYYYWFTSPSFSSGS